MQLALLDMFPEHRGAAVSMFTFFTLILNGLVAALVAPHVTASMFQVAVAAAVLIGAGVVLWTWHVLITRPRPAS